MRIRHRMSMRPVYSRALAAVIMAALFGLRALAQSPELTGQARAAADKHVLSCIRVVLEDSAGHDVASSRTDDRGLFAIGAPGAGVYRLRFELPQADPVFGPVDTLRDGASVERVYDLPFSLLLTREGPAWRRGPGRLAPKPGFHMPLYPMRLRMAGVEGSAVAEYVVDTTGQVVVSSITLFSQTNPDFGRAVTTALPAARFEPEREQGVAVCQRLLSAFVFTLSN